MSQGYNNIRKGLKIKPSEATAVSEEGDFSYNNTSDKFEYYDGTATRALVSEDKSATLSNKTLDNTSVITVKDANLTIQDDADTTKQVKFQASGITTGNTRVLTVPDSDTTIVGTAVSQTLSNKTLDNSTVLTVQDSNFTIQDNGDNTKQVKFEASGVTTATTRTLTVPNANTTITGTDATQTLSNKTFSDAVTIAEIATPSTPASGFGKVYFKSDNKLYSLDDAGVETQLGSGQGGVNYISANSDAETSVSGWSAYADAAATSPVDGTGGSPTTTITRTTSTPLRGTGSFLITKDAANRQGEGVSYDFTIAEADKASVQEISFEYNPSANFAAGDSSDIRIWIYDITNSQLIQPTPYTIQGGSGANHKFKAEFQSNSNSSSYRLIFHIATTNASAWTFKYDSVRVGPQVGITYGSPITDWSSALSVTPNALGTVTGTSYYSRRVGDDLEIIGYFTSGTPSASTSSFSLPSGHTIDLNKLPTGSGGVNVGMFTQLNDTTQNVFSNYSAALFTDGSDATQVFIAASVSSHAYVKSLGNSWGTNKNMQFRFRVPILGWASNVQISNDAETRVVAFKAVKTAAQSISDSTVTKVTWSSSTTYDTHSAFDSTNNRFVAPVSGFYRIGSSLYYAQNSSGFRELFYRVNGVATNFYLTREFGNATYDNVIAGTTEVKLNAGDYVEIFTNQNSGGALNAGDNAQNSYFTVERLSGPAAIAANELVTARYTGSGATSLTSGSTTVIAFATKDFDSHGAFSSNTFTAPVAGKYQVSVTAAFDSNSSGVRILYLKINGSTAARRLVVAVPQGGGVTVVNGNDIINMNTGDTVAIEAQQNSGSTINVGGDGTQTFVSIHRLGF